MDDNKWTATTSTSWIWFDEGKTLKTITGEGGQDISIYVDEATEPTTNVNGIITISANGTTFTKEINRCSPTVVDSTNTLDFRVYFSQINSGMAGSCENGTSASDSYGVKIRDIKLTTVDTYSNGNSKTTEKPLYESDVNIKYILPNGTSYNTLPSNKEQDREVNVKLELKQNTSIYAPTADQKSEDITTPYKYKFTQQGIKDVNGNYIESRLHDIGYSSESTVIRNFDISPSCKGQSSSSCSAGSYTFDVKGQNVTVFGAKTGLTECGEQVTIGGGKEEPHDISASDVTFSVNPTQYANFNGNVLNYLENDTRTTPRVLNITASYGGYTAETTYTVIASNECGAPIYIVARYSINSEDNESVDYTGGTATFTYYLSYSENGGEDSAIKDENINRCLSFSKLSPADLNVTIGETQKNNGVFTTPVTFIQNSYQNGEKGINWIFRISCETADNNPKDISIYQANKYEHLLPNCDYFIFSYDWKNTDGVDLDSLTHITNSNLIDKAYGANVGYSTVGYHGTADGSSIVYGEQFGQDRPFLVFGGDNRCSGSEYTVICIRNIMDTGLFSNDDIITVDIYANWYTSKKDGNMTIVYDQYSGTSENHYFINEIETIEHKECDSDGDGNPNIFYSYSPKAGTIKVAESVSTPVIHVDSFSDDAATEVKDELENRRRTGESYMCVGDYYQHVLTFNYIIKAKKPTIEVK